MTLGKRYSSKCTRSNVCHALASTRVSRCSRRLRRTNPRESARPPCLHSVRLEDPVPSTDFFFAKTSGRTALGSEQSQPHSKMRTGEATRSREANQKGREQKTIHTRTKTQLLNCLLCVCSQKTTTGGFRVLKGTATRKRRGRSFSGTKQTRG